MWEVARMSHSSPERVAAVLRGARLVLSVEPEDCSSPRRLDAFRNVCVFVFGSMCVVV